MTSITILVPAPLSEWVESRVESGRFGSADDYLRDLIDRDLQDEGEREADRRARGGRG